MTGHAMGVVDQAFAALGAIVQSFCAESDLVVLLSEGSTDPISAHMASTI